MGKIYRGEVSFREISRKLKIPYDDTKNIYKSGIEKLKKILEERGIKKYDL